MILDVPYSAYIVAMASMLECESHTHESAKYTEARKTFKAAMLKAVTAEMDSLETSTELPALLRPQAE